MEIAIIAATQDPLKVIWTAARTCYSALTPQELWGSEPSDEDMLRLVRRIFNSHHHSVVEHCSVTYAVSGVSRTLLAQYTRHRVGISFSVQSQRYVSERSDRNPGMFGSVVPPSIAGRPEAAGLYLATLRSIQAAYDGLSDLGVPKEDARFVLPGGAETNLVTTLNFRSLLDIYHKRVATPGAQWEIKTMVRGMAELLVAREPWLAEFFPGIGDRTGGSTTQAARSDTHA